MSVKGASVMAIEDLTPEWRAAWLAKWAHLDRPKRKPAEVVQFPDKLSEQELMRRQQAIDLAWQGTLDARQELKAVQSSGFHRGLGDPDYRR
jgi:hypothetical protein